FVALARTECRNFHRVLAEHHMNQTEPPPNDARAPENTAYLFRRSIGCHVEILRFQAKQQITDRPANDISGEAFLLQAGGNATCAGTDLFLCQAMLAARDDL